MNRYSPWTGPANILVHSKQKFCQNCTWMIHWIWFMIQNLILRIIWYDHDSHQISYPKRWIKIQYIRNKRLLLSTRCAPVSRSDRHYIRLPQTPVTAEKGSLPVSAHCKSYLLLSNKHALPSLAHTNAHQHTRSPGAPPLFQRPPTPRPPVGHMSPPAPPPYIFSMHIVSWSCLDSDYPKTANTAYQIISPAFGTIRPIPKL